MRINTTEQITSIAKQSQATKAPKRAADGFHNLLSQELELQTKSATEAVLPPGTHSLAFDPRLNADQMEAGQKAVDPKQVADKLEGLLDKWEKYSTQISTQGSPDLKGAFGTLKELAHSLTTLKQSAPSLQAEFPELDNVRNELEVMTVTEQFKLNRGDYLV
ncbi:hypothetical protein [Halodesulfovibrio sp.]|jgi:hypothetical protein|uniref:hypothetical protein n=1 Tax=Halodesulfovibrio sp. TaxID=1912772 RepID=UPI0025EF2F88|nr:hypothetical protein [Halodesulfovibrio sp.]MCT4534149.1 hypothetical protein [Halodesulfovibrio sp.]MCT4625913.1 hypothetical protein [Halodesulfovibrio sp.]